MMASCRSICQTTCVPVKGEENTNSEVLLHHRLPGKGQENVVLEKSSLNKEPEERMLMRKNTNVLLSLHMYAGSLAH